MGKYQNSFLIGGFILQEVMNFLRSCCMNISREDVEATHNSFLKVSMDYSSVTAISDIAKEVPIWSLGMNIPHIRLKQVV